MNKILFVFLLSIFSFSSFALEVNTIKTDKEAEALGMTLVDEELDSLKSVEGIEVGNSERSRKRFVLRESDLYLADAVIVINKSTRRYYRNSKGIRVAANPTGQTLRIYKNGVLLKEVSTSTGTEKSKTVTSGRTYTATTPAGIHRVKKVYNDYKSASFTGSDMKHAVFFIGGIAIHTTYGKNYKKLGTRASGGCARLRKKDAELVADTIRSTGEGHDRKTNESFTHNGVYLKRTKYTDRVKLSNFERFSGYLSGRNIWTYNAAVIVVTDYGDLE